MRINLFSRHKKKYESHLQNKSTSIMKMEITFDIPPQQNEYMYKG